MKAILRSINSFSCKLKQSNNLKYNISPKTSNHKLKSADGDGNVVIDDAIVKNLKDYKVYGNTYQNSTRGINIFNINNGGSTSSEISIDNDDYVSTAYNNANGSVTHYSNFMRNKTPQIRPSTNYLIVVEILSVQGTGRLQPWTKHAGSCINNSNPQLYFNNLTAGQKIFMPVTTKSEFDANTIYDLRTLIIFEAGQSGSITFRLSLLTDTTVTSDTFEYEPYTGGQPSPNPDYPQEIVSCGDRTKNLFDKDSEIVENKYYTDTGLIANSTGDFISETYIPVQTGNYTLSTSGSTTLRICTYDSSKNFIRREIATSSTLLNIVINSNEKYVRITGKLAEINSMQLEKGSIATSYEPYGYKIPVNVRSDNLFGLEYELETQYATGGNAITNYYSLNNDVVSISRSNATYGRYFFNKLTLDAGTYTLSFIPRLSGSDKRMNRSARNLDTQQDIVVNERLSINDGETQSFTFTLNSKQSISFSLQPSTNNSGTLDLTNIQLVKGSTAPAKYIPYYNQTTNIYLDEPLRKIGNYSDYIDFKNGKVVRNIGETIFDGTESRWAYYTDTNKPVFYMSYVNTDWFYNKTDIWACYCNYYKGKNNVSYFDQVYNYGSNSIAFRTQYPRLVIRDDNKTSLNDFKTWLETHNLKVDYVLATPTEEDIELPNINLIEGKNIITLGTELESIIEVEYYSKEIIDISNYKYNLRKVED